MSDEEQNETSVETQAEAQAPSPDAAAATGQPADDRPETDESAYKISLPSFHGPLDLLLHLIKQHKVDIYDIPILLITEQYTKYLDAMEQLDLEVAADYVYMAALLIHIKSRMLLPRDDSADDAEDPRADLVTRLLEYQRYKAVAETFAELDVLRMGVWPRPQLPLPGGNEASEIDMSEVSLFDLIDAFRTALNRYRQNHPQSIELVRMVHKVSAKMNEIYAKVKEKSPIRLQWFLEGRDRNELIAVFLGMLELVRLGGISLQQGGNFGDILIGKTEQEVDEGVFALYENS
ncbi:MAG TPA: segregation/condensation protein A [Thermoanaerobaculia bacterium]|nr:segregation/condensation protein A [Thermoanaerobaculia bacterium]